MNEAGTWHGVGLSPGDFVLDGDLVPFPQKGAEPVPNFRPISVVATWYGCRLQPMGLCVRWRPSLPSPTKGQSPLPIFGPFLCPNGWMLQDATRCYRLEL